MLALIKVTGDSMLPVYKEGDFVVVTKIPLFLRCLRKGDVIVFTRSPYGILIKKIERIISHDEIYVTGTHGDSLDSHRIGPINKATIIGRVILHIPKSK